MNELQPINKTIQGKSDIEAYARAEIMAEVQKEVSATLRTLYKQGIIDYIETVNSYAVKLKHTHTTNAKEK